eukprot:m51a1_g9320 putative serine-threonine protein (504) ;mRNA; f:135801-138720
MVSAACAWAVALAVAARLALPALSVRAPTLTADLCCQPGCCPGKFTVFEDRTGTQAVAGGLLRGPFGNSSAANISFFEIVQVLTPETVPYRYSRLCWKAPIPTEDFVADFLERPPAASKPMDVVLYEDVYGHPAETPSWVKTVDFAPLMQDTGCEYPPTEWMTHTAPLGLVVFSRRVHVGVRVSLANVPAPLEYYVSSNNVGRLSHYRHAPGSPWSSYLGDWEHDNITGLLLRLVSNTTAVLPGVPESWHCASASFNDGATCDCECGAWDPDCNASVAGPLSSNCSAGRVCDRAGHCVDPGWNTARCPLASFGGGDGCQCGCGGALDPDCRDSVVAGHWYPRADNCGAGYNVAKCSDDNACVETWPNCSSRRYGDGVCDCRCQTESGVLDPDCLVTNVSDCGWGHCNQGKCRNYPASWTCEVPAYQDNLCHCGCGSLDPDCGNFEVDDREECDGGVFCEQCACTPGHWPYDPPRSYCSGCNNSIVDSGEQCDSGEHCTAAVRE